MASGIPITEFIRLRSKMYSYIKDNDKFEKGAKGIQMVVVQKNIFFFLNVIQYLSRGIQFSRASLNGALTQHKTKT